MSHPLDFVTVEGLLAYGRALARRASERGLVQPPPRESSGDDADRVHAKMEQLRSFVERSKSGFATAEAYRSARESLIDDQLVFFAAWNALLAEGSLQPLLRATIGSVAKPTYRRPVAIVPRAQLTPTLAEGRIVLELGDDRFWLLPRDLADRTLFFTMRHGVSQVDSKTHRVGCRLPNQLDRERGVAKADAVGAALARMIGVVGQQLDFLHLANYLDPRTFLHCISRSPNTRQLYERVSAARYCKGPPRPSRSSNRHLNRRISAGSRVWRSRWRLKKPRSAFGVETSTAKRLMKDPLYCYPDGNSFFDLYVDVIDGLHRLGSEQKGKVACLYTHSSTLRALMIYLDPRPFHEAFSEFSDYKESQDNVVLLTVEQGRMSGYSTAVGLSERERVARNTWVTVEAREKRPCDTQTSIPQADRGACLRRRFCRRRRRAKRIACDRPTHGVGGLFCPARLSGPGQQLDRTCHR